MEKTKPHKAKESQYATLTDNIDFEARNISRDKEGQLVMITGSISSKISPNPHATEIL